MNTFKDEYEYNWWTISKDDKNCDIKNTHILVG